ncbi:pentatricopeptide repeat-containing protein at1g22960 mitochondrial [Phtheirospermum japonicum]|uniref:Pentatricopeptide repeat-containing protein at1g22960 mitochondrial n=1 Tax=Phtheirospermum japonicum TaxID=374723 RepID=A0A830BJ07_9LAMI|nr:pentatricopeptide repeat-containing protein at1g22960 mitochondrial [Phtheirospermum japonicum]
MTLCIITPKSLIPIKNLTSLCCFCSLNIGFSFKVRLIFFSSLAQNFHCSSEFNSFNSKAEANIINNGIVPKKDCLIKSSHGLYQNLILKTTLENPGAFRNIHWVGPDYFSSLVSDSDLFVSVIHSIRNRPRMILRMFRWAQGQKGFKHSEFVFCSVLEVLVQNNFMRSAYWVVQSVINSNMHNVVDVLIDGYLENEVSCKVLDLLLWLYTKKSDIERCLWVFDKMVKNMQRRGCSPNDVTFNVLINGLSKKGEFNEAKELIAEMSSKGLKVSAYAYNSLISGYCQKGMLVEAFGLGEEMKTRGAFPTLYTYNAFMHGYCKQGRVDYAKQWIGVMLKKNLAMDMISYNILIYGYCLLGDFNEALFLLSRLKKKRDLGPSTVTYNTIMDGLSKNGDIDGAKRLKDDMVRNGVSPDLFTYTILINGSYRKGNLIMAKQFYEEMLLNGLEPDRVTYTTCIAGELKLGDLNAAFKLQEEMLMKGFPADVITYNVFVDGISKLGDLREAYELLQKMIKDGFTPDHVTYTSIIHAHLDLGYLKKARELFDEMLSKGLSPTVVTYTVLIHAHAGQGRKMDRVYGLFYEMQDKGILPNKYTYTIMINENCDLGNWNEVLRLYKEMLDRGIKPDSCTHSALFKHLRKDYKSIAVQELECIIMDDDREKAEGIS